MKLSVIIKETSGLLRDWSFILLIPIIVALLYGELYVVWSFLVLFAGTLLVATLANKATHKTPHAHFEEGLIIIAITWLSVTVIGALVFYFNLPITYLDALFESMSSWTTTGLSVLHPEAVPHTILFWRSFGQWIGGLGVVVLAAGSLFRTGTAIFKAEGRDDHIKPNIVHSLRIMGGIYLLYTILGTLFLTIFGMSVFDAINHAMTAIATGGMSTKSASISAFSGAGIQGVLIALMFLGVVSFYHHTQLLRGKFTTFFKSIQNQVLLLLIIIPTILIVIKTSGGNALFHVVSAMGTGFTASNLSLWSPFGLTLLLFLMIIGGVAGSTAGGMKIHRVGIIVKQFFNYIKKLHRPHLVITNNYDGKHYNKEDIMRIFSFVLMYIVLLVIGSTIFILLGHDPFKSVFDVASAQGNVGLSSGIVYGNIEKVVLIILMWAGRLEIWAVLLTIINLIKGGKHT